MRSVLIAWALGVALLLGACGKKGPPSAPGPTSEIIYPRTYPTR
jgi:hypothetical protein